MYKVIINKTSFNPKLTLFKSILNKYKLIIVILSALNKDNDSNKFTNDKFLLTE